MLRAYHSLSLLAYCLPLPRGLAVESATGEPVVPMLNPTLAAPPKCDVMNCRQVWKYRLVSSWEKEACGMRHLKVLEGRVRS